MVCDEALYQPFPMAGAARGQIWAYAPQYRRPRHFHAEPELNLVSAGTGMFGAGTRVFSVAAGDLLFWLPGQDHVLLDASADFDLLVVGMAPALSDRVLGVGRAKAYGGPTRVRLAPYDTARLRATGGVAVGEEASAEWWHGAHALRSAPADKHILTRRALTSVLERPDLGRAEVAQRLGGHPSEVSRHFHENLGMTWTAFRARQRLLRFVGVVDGGGSLLAAALEAGFGSYSQCHRVFRGTLGCTPREFFRSPLRRRMGDMFLPMAASPL